MSDSFSRREFVATVGSIGAVWLLADTADRSEAMAHAVHQVGQAQPTLTVLTREQAAEVEAFASRIVPTDDTPGAREAGVVYFIDRGLTTWAKAQQPMFNEGLAKLGRDVGAKFSGQTRLSALTPEQQDEVLKSIEQTPFFGMMRFATLAGMFSLPSHGGNKDFVGWKLVGQVEAMEFKSPFSWYDQPANRRSLLGGDA
jgi:gluconate 2-dehydrogenase gamma chain